MSPREAWALAQVPIATLTRVDGALVAGPVCDGCEAQDCAAACANPEDTQEWAEMVAEYGHPRDFPIYPAPGSADELRLYEIEADARSDELAEIEEEEYLYE